MKTMGTQVRDAMGYCGVLIVVLASLPVLAFITIVFRLQFLFLGIAGLLGSAVLYCASGRFRSWVNGHLAGRPDGRHHPA